MSSWFGVAPIEELKPGQAKLVDTGDVAIAVYNLDGQYYAIEDICTHENIPILACGLPVEDLIEGDQLVCPRHGAHFDIKTGKALTPPAFEDISTFPVRIENGIIQVKDERQN